jgi:hypothetical protein
MFEDHLPPESMKNGYDDPSVGTVKKKPCHETSKLVGHLEMPRSRFIYINYIGGGGGPKEHKRKQMNKCFSKLPQF